MGKREGMEMNSLVLVHWKKMKSREESENGDEYWKMETSLANSRLSGYQVIFPFKSFSPTNIPFFFYKTKKKSKTPNFTHFNMLCNYEGL